MEIMVNALIVMSVFSFGIGVGAVLTLAGRITLTKKD